MSGHPHEPGPGIQWDQETTQLIRQALHTLGTDVRDHPGDWRSLTQPGRRLLISQEAPPWLGSGEGDAPDLLDSPLVRLTREARAGLTDRLLGRNENQDSGDQSSVQRLHFSDMTTLPADLQAAADLECLMGNARTLTLDTPLMPHILGASTGFRAQISGPTALLTALTAREIMTWLQDVPRPQTLPRVPKALLRRDTSDALRDNELSNLRDVVRWWQLTFALHGGRATRVPSPAQMRLMWDMRAKAPRASAAPDTAEFAAELCTDLGFLPPDHHTLTRIGGWLGEARTGSGHQQQVASDQRGAQVTLWKVWGPDPEDPARSVIFAGHVNRSGAPAPWQMWSAAIQRQTQAFQAAGMQAGGMQAAGSCSPKREAGGQARVAAT